MTINVDKTRVALTKLYDKRAALDKQIITAQKTLMTAACDVAKPKKPAAKKPSTAKRTVAKKVSPKEPILKIV